MGGSEGAPSHSGLSRGQTQGDGHTAESHRLQVGPHQARDGAELEQPGMQEAEAGTSDGDRDRLAQHMGPHWRWPE